MSTPAGPTTPAAPAAPTQVLNVTNIQGDVILGLPKKVQEYVFFQITDVTPFRQKIYDVVPYITTLAQTIHDEAVLAKHKKMGGKDLIRLSGMNVSFSHAGLTKMGITEDLQEPLFTAGQINDAEALGDRGTTQNNKFVPDWDPGFLQQLDGVFLFTAECKNHLAENIERINKILDGTIKTVFSIFGNVRPGNEAGHEHFGFQDGISQPGIQGFTTLNPGQEAVSPGVVLLGNGTEPRTSTLAKDGSFLVFRKLDQLVPEFNAFLLKNGAGLDGLTPQEGAEFLGARLVGRWKSGAPIDVTPLKDDPALGKDASRNNNFAFNFQNPDDQTDQTRCPFAAHIRKTNPRADLESLGASTASRRLLRQGIPFGPEVTDEENKEQRTIHERGLAFVCYQSIISNGFAFVQKSWVNNTSFPPKNINGVKLSPGFDPLIGQQGSSARSMIGFDPKSQSNSLSMPNEFIVSRGGEYFFTPSITALMEVISTV